MQDAILPLSAPITGVDGCKMHEIAIPKGTMVIVSVVSSNCDPALWGPDSFEWKPERWLSPLPESLTDAHMPGIYSHQSVPFSIL
jgi:cytochrome P450